MNGSTGYSGNSLLDNDVSGGGNVEANGVLPAHPNACAGTCP
jgi:hypothetical protein